MKHAKQKLYLVVIQMKRYCRVFKIKHIATAEDIVDRYSSKGFTAKYFEIINEGEL